MNKRVRFILCFLVLGILIAILNTYAMSYSLETRYIAEWVIIITMIGFMTCLIGGSLFLAYRLLKKSLQKAAAQAAEEQKMWKLHSERSRLKQILSSIEYDDGFWVLCTNVYLRVTTHVERKLEPGKHKIQHTGFILVREYSNSPPIICITVIDGVKFYQIGELIDEPERFVYDLPQGNNEVISNGEQSPEMLAA